jgi:hypothetical protein
MTLSIPPGWTAVKAPASMSRFLQYFLRMMASQGGGPADDLRSVPFVRLSTDPGGGLKGPKDAVLTVAAADLGAKALTYSQALKFAGLLLENSPVPAKFRGKPHDALLGGIHAGAFETELAFKEKPLLEASRFVFRKGHVVVFHVSAASPDGLRAGLDVLESIRWRTPAEP